jgi:hypothetical protein
LGGCKRSNEAAMGGGVSAQSAPLRVNEPKNTGARSTA